MSLYLKPGMNTAVIGIGGLGHIAIKFLKKKALYPKKHALPKIYASKKNQKLLNSKNIPPKFL